MINKLIIGTANFGLDYGIANKRRLDREVVFDILDFAHSAGTYGIDTAKVYGDAEDLIGEFFATRGKVFNVMTKLPKKEYKTFGDVEKEVIGSASIMNIDSIDFVLIHSYETYTQYGKILIPALRSLCRDNIIRHYGLSAYHREDVEDFLKNNECVAIEFPLNLFDRRFLKGGLLQSIKSNGNFLFARSVFLQGLFFLNDNELKGKFANVIDKVRTIREISRRYKIAPECLAFLFVITKPFIDGVIIGVDSKLHLMSNIQCLDEGQVKIYGQIEHLLSDLEVDNEDIILPYRWNV